MHIITCFSYEDLKLVLSMGEESITIQLNNDKDINIAVTLQPMQCRILGEALFNVSGRIPVRQLKGEFVGSMQVEFDLEREKEEVPCQLQDLSVLMDKKSLFRIA